MRIVIERRTELADHGMSDRRIEVEIDTNDVPEAVFIAQKLMAVLDSAPPHPPEA